MLARLRDCVRAILCPRFSWPVPSGCRIWLSFIRSAFTRSVLREALASVDGLTSEVADFFLMSGGENLSSDVSDEGLAAVFAATARATSTRHERLAVAIARGSLPYMAYPREALADG